ncbi:outer membrane protein [Helicobacter cetorum]|uniref:outer membrane protein n=1 Tax=Helicobacter cetorum TaxID=138563 RepID=UPI000CF16641|nr:outer membrane protein [Helicobacter cetorum]
MKKFVVFGALCLSVALLSNLVAAESNIEKHLDKPEDHKKKVKGEKDAWYVGISYQVGQASESVRNPERGNHYNIRQFPVGKTDYLAVMQGIGLTVGYKQFYGAKRWFGMRYYGFMDYGHSNFGGGALTGWDNNVCDPQSVQAGTPCGMENLGTDKDPVYNNAHSTRFNNISDMFTYGVGIDTLYNVINRENASFGFFFGAQIAGNSWGNTLGSLVEAKDTRYKHQSASIDPAIFQFLFNLGMRTHIGKHQGFDFGVKIPTINVYYFNEGGLNVKYRRQYSIYVGYRYNF